MLKKIIGMLKLPESQQIKDLDDQNNIYILRNIIQKKAFLRNIYLGFYQIFMNVLSPVQIEGEVIELVSGAGFFKKIAPDVIYFRRS